MSDYKFKCELKCDFVCKSKVNLEIHVATAHYKFNDKCEPWFHAMRMKTIDEML